MKNTDEQQQIIRKIRGFNRFYTDVIGLLNQHFLNSPYSLAEGRILFEISKAGNIQASKIMTVMHIDKSYLSRLLKKLEKENLIVRKPSKNDARAVEISLTEKGNQEFEVLNQRSEDQIKDLLQSLSAEKSRILAEHMTAITDILK
jgi:DNA-binding MarR family transcriptional regulator